MPSTATSTAYPLLSSSFRSISRTVMESSTTKICFRSGVSSSRRDRPIFWSRWAPVSMPSMDRTRSSMSKISTGAPSSMMAMVLMSETFPRRGSRGRTTRSYSPTKASTMRP